jgi:hypothetical protein
MMAVVVPLGVILATKDDPGQEIAGVTLLVRGGWDLLSIPLSLMPSPTETLLRHYDERTARGEAAADRNAETEREWQHAIEERRGAVVLNAVTNLVLGSLGVAMGMLLLLQEPTPSVDRREQDVWGTVVLGASLPFVAGGIGAFFGDSSMEDRWKLYQSGKPGASARVSPTFKVVPIRSGMAGAFELVF